MITDRSTLSSPIWPQDQTANILETQNMPRLSKFGAITQKNNNPEPQGGRSHSYTYDAQSVYLYRPTTQYSISDALYKQAEPDPSVAFIMQKDSSGNYALNIPTENNRKVYVTHIDPKDTLYAHQNEAGTGLEVIRRENTGLNSAQDIMIQETEAPHIFRLFNKDATLGPELYAYPREISVPTAFVERKGWAFADPASYDRIMSNAFTKTNQGTKQQVNNFLGPIDVKELDFQFPAPLLAGEQDPSSPPAPTAFTRTADANRQWEENYSSTPAYRPHKNDYVADDADMDAIAAQFAALEASNNTPPTTAGSSKTITAADGMNDTDFAAYLRRLETENDVNHDFVNTPEPEVDDSKNKGKGRA